MEFSWDQRVTPVCV